ncbi:hypothetical protein D3C77_563510 [compost metagenome]
MHRIQLHAQSIRDHLIDLIPGHRLIGRDMNRLADRMDVAHQAYEALGKIAIMRHCPQGGAVAMNDDRLVLQHPLSNLPASLAPMYAQRYRALGVRMTWPYNRNREPVLPVLLHQIFLTSDFVSGIFPIWIGQRRAFRNSIIG